MKRINIVGAGPAGLFCIIHLLKLGFPGDKIRLFDSGPSWQNREKKCYVNEQGQTSCIMCKEVCNVLQGFGGAGGYSDGKINISRTIGGDIERDDIFVWFQALVNTIKGLDKNLEPFFEKRYHNDETTLYHLGTDGCAIMLSAIEKLLIGAGVEMNFNCRINSAEARLLFGKKEIFVFAVGRTGNKYIESMLNATIKNHKRIVFPSAVDIGFRVELPAWFTEHLTNRNYEFKLRHSAYGLDTRTFCVNPNGYVIVECLDGTVLLNGHSYSDPERKSDRTNFAVLAKIPFREANKPNEYALGIAKACNNLNLEHTISQRLVDFMLDRTTNELDYVLGDIFNGLTHMGAMGNLNFVYPARIATALKEGMKEFSKDIPDLFNTKTWIHGVEAKCYSNRVSVDENFMVANRIYCIGDGSGITRGLSQAAISGMIAAQDIVEKGR